MIDKFKTLSKENLFQFIQAWLTTSLFALVLTFFLSALLMSPFQMKSLLIFIPLTSLFIYLVFNYWKVSGPVILVTLLLLIFQFISKKSWQIPIFGLSFWTGLIGDFKESAGWALKSFDSRGAMPESFNYILPFSLSFISVLTNWILPIPLLNMAFLIAPMFFINDFSNHPNWMLYLLLGLFCIYSSYAYRQDPEDRDQRPPLLFASILIILTFTLQTILPASLFFNENLSRILNDYLPQSQNNEIKNFSLGELGFYPRGNLKVGGPVKLDDETYLTIKAEADSFYLRGSAYDSFDGISWYLANKQKLERYDRLTDFFDDFSTKQASSFWFSDSEMRNRAFSNNILTPTSYFIKTAGETNIVFHGGKPMSLSHLSKEVPDGTPLDDIFKNYHDGSRFYYSSAGSLVADRPYNEYGLVELDYVNLILNVRKMTWAEVFTPIMMPPARQYENTVRHYDPELAKILYDENNNISVLLAKMRQHIDKNYSYELDVPYPKDSENFIEHFLKNKKGYCVYFASLYSVLLNDIGYQTRYAEGFVVPQEQDPAKEVSERKISALQAHAWTELNVEGVGWLPVEATPSSHIADLSGISDQAIKDPTDPMPAELFPESSEESSDISLENESSEESNAENHESSDHNDDGASDSDFSDQGQENEASEEPISPDNRKTGWIVYLIGLIALSVLLASLWAYRSYKAYLYSLDPAKILKKPDKRAIFAKIWTSIKRLHRLNELEEKNTDTVSELVHKWKFLLTDELADLDETEASESIERFLYSKEEITDDDLLKVHKIYKGLAEKYRTDKPKAVWFINEILLGR